MDDAELAVRMGAQRLALAQLMASFISMHAREGYTYDTFEKIMLNAARNAAENNPGPLSHAALDELEQLFEHVLDALRGRKFRT